MSWRLLRLGCRERKKTERSDGAHGRAAEDRQRMDGAGARLGTDGNRLLSVSFFLIRG